MDTATVIPPLGIRCFAPVSNKMATSSGSEHLHAEDSEDGQEHHVHFPENVSTNTDIHVQMKGDNIVNVHLGFLQHLRKYAVQFTVPVSAHSKQLKATSSSLFVVVTNVVCQDDCKGHEVTLELNAHKQGLLRDKFYLKNDEDQEFVVVLHARVLGHNKGTPMLKDGIHCIGAEKNEDEEHSDWQGFD